MGADKWTLGAGVIKAQVTVTNSNTGHTTVVEVSTSNIPTVPETCLFWPDDRNIMGRGSAVVQTYDSWEKAREGHAKWVADPYRVAQAMVDAGWEPR